MAVVCTPEEIARIVAFNANLFAEKKRPSSGG
jgi:hypothetical protein